MVVDAEGRSLTQRSLPAMALIETRLQGESLLLSAPRAGSHRLPRRLEEGPTRRVEVWGDRVDALEERQTSAFFAEALGRPAHAVYMPERSQRPAGGHAPKGTLLSFADAYPLLALSEASLNDLNSRLASAVGMSRFRPNIVVSGATPYAEDRWRSVRMGEISLRGVKRCDRCVMTTVDPATGERGREPLKTLAGYRLEEGKVWFGMNLVAETTGTLRVGDDVMPGEGGG